MRTAQLLSFVRRRVAPDWSTQDIAEFYRVEAILVQSGLKITSARGLTDEGDPWFVFCRADDDEVIIHFARIDGRYVISSPAYCGNAAGYDFRTLVRGMIEAHPVLRPKPSGDNLFLHPAALLVTLVATAFLKFGHAAEAASTSGSNTGASAGSDAAVDTKSRTLAVASGTSTEAASVALDATRETLLLSAINAAIVASVPQNTITEAAASASFVASDVSDQSQGPLANAMATDRPHDAQATESSGMSPVPVPQSVIASAEPVATSHAPAHSSALNDALTVRLSSPEPLHYQNLPDSSSTPAPVTPVDMTPDTAAGVQHVSLSGLADIPYADKVLLQALGVPDMVAYTPTPPAAISTVILAGTHTGAVSVVAGTESPTPSATVTTSTDNTTHSVPEPVNPTAPPTNSGTTVAQGAAAPMTVVDVAMVMKIVLSFEAVEAQPTVLVNDHGVIFYDAAAINTQYSAVQSVKYDLGDGFSISLVGLHVELTHAGALV